MEKDILKKECKTFKYIYVHSKESLWIDKQELTTL